MKVIERIARLTIAAALLLFSACQQSGAPSAETIAAERAAVAADAAARDRSRDFAVAGQPAAVASAQGTIDPPANANATRIISSVSENGSGRDVCVISVAYAGAVVQDAIWTAGRCEDAEISLIPVSALEAAGQLADLEAEAARDIQRSPGGRVLYAEGEFAASAFPLNAASRVYEVTLAD